MINPISPVSNITARTPNDGNGQQNQTTPSGSSATQGADAVAQSSAAGTVDLARTGRVTAPEAVARGDASPAARSALQNLSLPTRADARSVMMAIASDRDPQVLGPDADMAAQAAAAERERIMSRAQAIVEAVMAQDLGVVAQDPYSAAKSGRHI